MKKLIYIFFIFFFALNTNAQKSTDEQLALQYYQAGEYDKALVYYEKLYNREPINLYYKYYLNCLIQTKDFKKAEKTAKRQIKEFSEDLTYIVDLGNIYKASEDTEKAKKEYERAVKELSNGQEQTFTLAKAFIDIQEWDHAIETYKKGRKLLNNTYPFSFELAEVYRQKGDDAAMINEYLDVLLINDSYISSVQNALQASFGNEANIKKNELLKTELYRRIQKHPDNTIFSDLLIWMLIQEKDFEAAFVQAKALDKRKKEDGERLMSLAELSASNDNYDVAAKSYQYVISKGSQNYNYMPARIELLNVLYKKIVINNNYTQPELIDLEKNYQTTLQELGININTVPLMKSLAHLQAFYLHKPAEAIELLNEGIAIPKLTPHMQAQCKLELGDILLMTGDIWEASLTYSQVEKAFWHDVLGQEAKFRNAKVAYYNGDFKWAQAQLDVLKAATAKLIANDAMDLSLLISDNTFIDTNTVPLHLFAKADLLIFQNKDEEAVVKLDSINSGFPNHALADDIIYKKYFINFKKGRFIEAAAFLENIIANFPESILADDAMFKLAELNENKLNNKQKAMELYQDILVKFPGSLYTVEARKKYRALRGDMVN